MRIAFDLQGIQSEASRLRGIGRYSFEIVKNILENGSDHEYILFANGALKDVKFEFKDQLKSSNVSYFIWYSPCPLDYRKEFKPKFTLAKYLRSYALSNLNIDVLIITSFLEGFNDNCLTEIDHDSFKGRVVTIFYDLIPLLNSHLYLKSNNG